MSRVAASASLSLLGQWAAPDSGGGVNKAIGSEGDAGASMQTAARTTTGCSASSSRSASSSSFKPHRRARHRPRNRPLCRGKPNSARCHQPLPSPPLSSPALCHRRHLPWRGFVGAGFAVIVRQSRNASTAISPISPMSMTLRTASRLSDYE